MRIRIRNPGLTQIFVLKLSEIMVGSGIWRKPIHEPIPDHGVKKAPDPGSAELLRWLHINFLLRSNDLVEPKVPGEDGRRGPDIETVAGRKLLGDGHLYRLLKIMLHIVSSRVVDLVLSGLHPDQGNSECTISSSNLKPTHSVFEITCTRINPT